MQFFRINTIWQVILNISFINNFGSFCQNDRGICLGFTFKKDLLVIINAVMPRILELYNRSIYLSFNYNECDS